MNQGLYAIPDQLNVKNDSLVTTLINKCDTILRLHGDVDSAKVIIKILDSLISQPSSEHFAAIFNLKGYTKVLDGDYDGAIQTYKEKYVMDSVHHRIRHGLTSLQALSNLFFNKGDYAKSLSYDIKCIEISQQNDLIIEYAICLQNKATNHELCGDTELAKKSYEEAMSTLDTITIKKSLADPLLLVYTNYTVFLLKEKSDTLAISRSLKKQKQLLSRSPTNQPEFEGSFYQSLSQFLYTKNQLDSALYYNHLALSTYLQNKSKFLISATLNTRAKIFFDKGDIDSSLVYVNQSLEISNKLGLLQHQFRNHELRSKIYEKKGNLIGSLEELKRYELLKDSFNLEENRAKFNRLKTNFELTQKDQKLKIQNLKLSENKLILSKKRQIISVLLLALCIFFGLIFTLLILRRTLRNKLDEVSKQNEIILKSQLEITEKTNEISNLIEQKERELFSHYLIKSRNSLIVEDCINNLKKIRPKDDSINSNIHKVINSLQLNIASNERWDNFNYQFKNIEPMFIKKISNQFPFLTPNELKHCAFVRLNLSNKETADLLGVAHKSVEIARYRIKKKMELSSADSLYSFLNTA